MRNPEQWRFLKETLINMAVQIAADDLYPSRRQTAVIAVLCRGFVDNEGTNQMRQDGLPD